MARKRHDEARRIGARIAELREERHWTQAAAADRAKVAYRTWQTWEAGDATPRWHNYERLAAIFGVSVDEILGAPNGEPVAVEHAEMEADETALRDQVDRIEAKLDSVIAALGIEETADVHPLQQINDLAAALPELLARGAGTAGARRRRSAGS